MTTVAVAAVALGLSFVPYAPAHADNGATVPYPTDPDRPLSAGVPGGIDTPTPPGSGTITPPTPPFLGGVAQGPTSRGMAGHNLVGDPPWLGFGPGGMSTGGWGALDVGQGDTHPANVPYPARFP